MPAVVVLPAPFGPSRPKISPGLDAQVEPVHGREVGARVDLGQVLGADDRAGLAVRPGPPLLAVAGALLMACTSYAAPGAPLAPSAAAGPGGNGELT